MRELTGYRPFFNIRNATQQLSFAYPAPAQAGYFGLGRVSRDDANKYLCLPIMPSERSADVDRRAK